ncbi:MAG: WbqC family protein [bacterium]|nr:WbqC family protein [bacterium]
MSTKTVAILQSAYVPWRGYFDLIRQSDEFVLYDDVQYTKNDWRNRNRIKTDTGFCWLTIPVSSKGRFGQTISEVEICDRRWTAKHRKTLRTYYARAAFFDEVFPALRDLYEQVEGERFLSCVNEFFLRELCKLLGIGTHISRSTDYEVCGGRVERLVDLCERLGATEYLSGPAAKTYLDESQFHEKGIAVCWMNYSDYPRYQQLFRPPFLSRLSILDLLLNEGLENSPNLLVPNERSTRSGPGLTV